MVQYGAVAHRIAVIGGGIVGLATATELSHRHPSATVTVLEKELGVGRHQTSHNSGVVHAGLYYPVGSLKARLCSRGRTLLEAFCRARDLPYEECGKLVIASTAAQVALLDSIESRARANGVPDLRRLDRRSLLGVEPAAAGVAALHSPRTAITDFAAVAGALAHGLEVRTGFEVQAVRAHGSGVVITGTSGGRGGIRPDTAELTADRVVICAGLQSDTLIPDGREPMIIPFRGEYWRLIPEWSERVRGLIYPVPDPRYPFLGVHFTKRVDGRVDVGPNAVLGLAREGYRRSDVDAGWLLRTATRPAFWRMARRHWRAGAHELAGSLSKQVFVQRAATLLPGLTPSAVVRAPAGVRAQAVDGRGNLIDDFRITRSGRAGQVVAVQNAPSPAATSALAIAEHICDQLEA